MNDKTPAEMQVTARKRAPWRNLSLVWLVPILALAVTLVIAWQSWAERGTYIEIVFENAAGVVQDETTIRYRDVVIGTVESVEFASDLTSVVVGARIDNTVAESIPAEAEFWVVRPEVSTSGISGLSTVLSGVYIEAGFEPQPGSEARNFEGLNETPLVLPGMKGTRIILRTNDGTRLTAGAGIFHQGIQVGRIETPRFLDSGPGVIVDAFIEAPHDRRITTATRFWDTSGFDVNFGPSGLSLSVDSVAALIQGGIAFDTVFSGGRPVPAGYIFDLFDSESAARESVFADTIANAVELTVEFTESVRGLEVGSPVTYSGLRVGAVSALGAFIEDGPNGQEVKLRAQISIDPRSLGLDPDTPQADTIAFLATAVNNGLRARLSSQSIFSNSLVVELVELPDAEPATLGIFDQDAPLLPSVESDIPDITATAEGLLQRVNSLPVEELLNQAISTMAAIETLAADDKLRDAPAAFTGLLEDARGLIGAPETQALPEEIGQTVAALRDVVEGLQTADAAGALVRALDGATEATTALSEAGTGVSSAIEGVPELVTQLEALAQKANALQLEAAVQAATDALTNADKLVAGEDAQALPGDIRSTLADLRGIALDLQEAGFVQQLTEALEAAEAAANEVVQVSSDLGGATEDVPLIVEDLRNLVDKANNLPLEELAQQATDLLESADTLLGLPSTRDLPENLNGALDALRATLEELRQGGVVENANATLASARDAAAAIEQAAESLPALSSRIQSLVAQTETVVAGYGDRSDFNRETVAALREVQKAAEALTKLARAIERNPNSLLFGR